MEVETAVCAKLFRGETEQVRKVIEIKKEKGNEVKGGNYNAGSILLPENG